ncbi:MAG: hypothetical protein ABFD54_15495 [Armatimonadota bacterium]|nr:hypothetical protein [bacterium]
MLKATKILGITAVAVTFLSLIQAAFSADHWDCVADFSTTNNPSASGAWLYGCTDWNTLWTGGPFVVPLSSYNTSTNAWTSTAYTTNPSISLDSGSLLLKSGLNSSLALKSNEVKPVIQWTSPGMGKYHVVATYTHAPGIMNGNASEQSAVRITKNFTDVTWNQCLAEQTLTSGGPSWTYDSILPLLIADTVEFQGAYPPVLSYIGFNGTRSEKRIMKLGVVVDQAADMRGNLDMWLGDANGVQLNSLDIAPGSTFTVSVWCQTPDASQFDKAELLLGFDTATTMGASASATQRTVTASNSPASAFASGWSATANGLGGGDGSGTRPYGAHVVLTTASPITATTPIRLCDITLKNNIPAGSSQTIALWNYPGTNGWSTSISRGAYNRFEFPAARGLVVNSTISAQPTSISNIKKTTDGGMASCNDMTVTTLLGDYFFIEDATRSCGIRVKKAGHPLEVGYTASITGIMATMPNGERYIDATNGSASGAQGKALTPVAMNNCSLGGGDLLYEATLAQAGVSSGYGLNNIGILVRTWGKVANPTANTNEFAITDGSGVQVNVICPEGMAPADNAYVMITGISSCSSLHGSRLIIVGDSGGSIQRL